MRFSWKVLITVFSVEMLSGVGQLRSQESAVAEEASTKPADVAFDNSPVLELLGGEINNALVYETFLDRAQKLVKSPKNLKADALAKKLAQRNKDANKLANSVAIPSEPISSNRSVYERMARASLFVGAIYDCGNCDKLHANIAGGVLVSRDGLLLTNHHVVAQCEQSIEGLVVMSHDGRCWPIIDVIATSQQNDVALLRIDCDESLEPCEIAAEEPLPLTPVNVLSNPLSEFFVLTQGVVSRYMHNPISKGTSGQDPLVRFFEITAEYSAGSSGSGVFNDRGQLVGLVSRIFPLFRDPELSSASVKAAEGAVKSHYPEMILKRCVPLKSVRALFDETSG